MADEIFTGKNKFDEKNDECSVEIFKKQSDKQPENTDMPDLVS